MISNKYFFLTDNKEQFIKIILNFMHEDLYNLINMWRE